ncbi:proton-conducting transporter membrane subunit [Haloferula sp.]|uniref:proton-conducting transporter transmembrane domain-containing protein n=1 Tax=Haloferula sp. TaxID=2497595 RepID=UPI0032A09FCF
MVEQLPVIVVLTPMFAALAVALVSLWRPSLAFPITMLGLVITVSATIATLGQVMAAESHRIVYYLGNWKYADDGVSPIGIQLVVDGLSGLVLVVIATVSLLVGIYSLRNAPGVTSGKRHHYYTLFLLLNSGLLGMTITGDAFNVFVLLEVASLTSYGLIAMGRSRRGSAAAFNYVIMGTIGASFYLLGVGYLYAATGSLNMEQIHSILQNSDALQTSPKTVTVAFIMIMLGLMVKMAFFPLHGWITNAYSYSPSASSSVLAPLVTKVSVYVMIRMILTVFGPEYAFTGVWIEIVVWLAVIAIIAGSVFALAQREFKRMLCYLIVAEVGYMVGGIWLANHWGMVGATYHIISDAFMTLTLFLAASIIWNKTKNQRITGLDGILKKMPITMVGLIVAALAMIGVPPTCGFFSKWYLIRGGIESGRWEYVVALLVSSLVNAILFFRIIEIAYFGKKPAEGHGHDDDHGEEPAKIDEAPVSSLIALLAAASGVILIGVFNRQIIGIITWVLEGAPIVGGS